KSKARTAELSGEVAGEGNLIVAKTGMRIAGAITGTDEVASNNICEPDNVPQMHEITRVLKYMSEIAATDQSSTPVVDFVEVDKLLHVTDPFFAFYLRWGKISSS